MKQFKTGITPGRKRHQWAFKMRMRQLAAVATVLIPDDDDSDAEEHYETHLRKRLSITPSKLIANKRGGMTTKTPREREFVPVKHFLPQVSSYGMQQQFMQMLQHESASARPAKRLKSKSMEPTEAKDKLPVPPEEPFKLTVFTIDCSKQPKKKVKKVKSNHQVMGYMSANNSYTHEIYTSSSNSLSGSDITSSESDSEESAATLTSPRSFEHTHLSANHYKKYHCEVVAGEVDPHNPDDPNNMTEAPKETNSQMMPAELVVDALYDQIYTAFAEKRLDNIPGNTSPWQNIKTDHAKFNRAFNKTAPSLDKSHLLVGVLVKLQTDDEGDITHNAATIDYYIAWNGECIYYQFDVMNARTPAMSEVKIQRDYLAPFFEKYFASEEPVTQAPSESSKRVTC